MPRQARQDDKAENFVFPSGSVWPSSSDVVGFTLSQGDGHTKTDQDR